MADQANEPSEFFDRYPRFIETSKTGPARVRLNARHRNLIERHRHLLEGATVLDLASHDGRFSFAALEAGAARVVGIEIDPTLVEAAQGNMAAYGVDPARYQFVLRDMFRHFDDLVQFDVVLCFGIFYHVNDHMQLLSNIAGVEPHWLILDTKVSQLEGAVIELRSMLGASPPPPRSHLEGYPSRLAVEAMVSSFGWDAEYVDWIASGLADEPGLGDYRDGRRISLVVDCGERVAPDIREWTVGLVRGLEKDRNAQWMTIRGVAAKFEINPYALRTWVLRAEGDAPAPSDVQAPPDATQ